MAPAQDTQVDLLATEAPPPKHACVLLFSSIVHESTPSTHESTTRAPESTTSGLDSGPQGLDSGPQGVDSGPQGVDSGPCWQPHLRLAGGCFCGGVLATAALLLVTLLAT
jgi:hypothetical protein